jgi:hypothetical protein
VELGRWYVFALRWVTAVRFGRRPTREELLGDRLLLTAFRMSDPTEELRGDAFLEQAAERLEGVDLAEAREAFQRLR